MNENELRDGLAYVAAELRSIHESAGDAPLDADTQTRFDAGTAYVTETRAAIAAIETRRAQVAELASIPTSVERGAPEPVESRGTVNVNLNRDPWQGYDSRRAASMDAGELRDLALSAAERAKDYDVKDEFLGAVDETLRKYPKDSETGRGIARHIIETGSPEYVRGFESYYRNPAGGVPQEMRAAMSTTAANGGVLIPHFLDPSIILTNSGTNNPMRQVCNVKQITTKTWEGVTSAGVTGEWIAEATEVADGSPTFVGPTITPVKADAYLQASMEVLADSGFNEVAMLFADAKDRLEEAGYTTGNGVTQPFGIISATSGTGPSVAGSSGAAGAADFVIADVYAVKNALSPRFRRNAVWMANPTTLDAIRQFGNAASGSNAANFWTDLGADIPPSLLGKRVLENESMDSTRVSGSNDDILCFFDPNEFLIVDRIGMEIAYNPIVLGSNRRPTGESAWVASRRTSSNVTTSNAFKTLRV